MNAETLYLVDLMVAITACFIQTEGIFAISCFPHWMKQLSVAALILYSNNIYLFVLSSIS
jgi:hypothetical protein